MSKYIDKDTYDKIVTLMPIVCVDVCIQREKGILLVKRNTEPAKDQWWLPGGRVVKGELLHDCAKRKCLEEVGLDCVVGPIIHTDETIFDTGPSGIPIHSINVCFQAIPKSLAIKTDEYCDDYKWVSSIDSTLSTYVLRCLKGAGLK